MKIFISAILALCLPVWGYTTSELLRAMAKVRHNSLVPLKESANLNKMAEILAKTGNFNQGLATVNTDMVNFGLDNSKMVLNPKTKTYEPQFQKKTLARLASNLINSIGYAENGQIAVLVYAYIAPPLILDMNKLVVALSRKRRVVHNPALSELAKGLSSSKGVVNIAPLVSNPTNMGFSCANHPFDSLQAVADYFGDIIPDRYKEIGAALYSTNAVCMVYKA